MGSGDTVINVCTESLQRDGAFAVAFASSDFSAAQTAGNGNFDTLGTSAHGSADALFYSTAEADTSFELGSDVFADQDSAHVSGFDFQDVDVDFFVGNSSESFFDVLDACAATADDHARFSGINRKLYTAAYAFNANFGNACCEQVLL